MAQNLESENSPVIGFFTKSAVEVAYRHWDDVSCFTILGFASDFACYIRKELWGPGKLQQFLSRGRIHDQWIWIIPGPQMDKKVIGQFVAWD